MVAILSTKKHTNPGMFSHIYGAPAATSAGQVRVRQSPKRTKNNSDATSLFLLASDKESYESSSIIETDTPGRQLSKFERQNVSQWDSMKRRIFQCEEINRKLSQEVKKLSHQIMAQECELESRLAKSEQRQNTLNEKLDQVLLLVKTLKQNCVCNNTSSVKYFGNESKGKENCINLKDGAREWAGISASSITTNPMLRESLHVENELASLKHELRDTIRVQKKLQNSMSQIKLQEGIPYELKVEQIMKSKVVEDSLLQAVSHKISTEMNAKFGRIQTQLRASLVSMMSEKFKSLENNSKSPLVPAVEVLNLQINDLNEILNNLQSKLLELQSTQVKLGYRVKEIPTSSAMTKFYAEIQSMVEKHIQLVTEHVNHKNTQVVQTLENILKASANGLESELEFNDIIFHKQQSNRMEKNSKTWKELEVDLGLEGVAYEG
mmetsp:Transcript_15369/g.20194  ORF Transcript_15369/g.20194 Transcript_15369/m.20194 type:complete len:437 (-) Transcript_15369:1766-3076(-)